jgi:hypothetical protein
MTIIMRFNEVRKNEKVKGKMDAEWDAEDLGPGVATKPLDILR